MNTMYKIIENLNQRIEESIKSSILYDVSNIMKNLKDLKNGMDFKINGKKVVYGKLRNEASNYPDKIVVGDKFFEVSKDSQKYILIHEACHDVISEFLENNKGIFSEILDSEVFGDKIDGRFDGIFGNFQLEEAMTDALTVYISNKEELKNRYPKAFEYIKKNFKV